MTRADITFLKDLRFWIALSAAPFFYLLYGLTFYEGEILSVSFIDSYRQLLLLIIIYPILEELVFRGFLQSIFHRLFGGFVFFFGLTLPNIITSVFFAFSHLINHDLIWSFAIFFPSLLFGYFRDKYDSTKPSIILHVSYNFGFYFLFLNA